MKVLVNHVEVEAAAGATVARLLCEQKMPETGIAVAVNNKVVPRTQWDSVRLAEGDCVTVIRAVCGG